LVSNFLKAMRYDCLDGLLICTNVNIYLIVEGIGKTKILDSNATFISGKT